MQLFHLFQSVVTGRQPIPKQVVEDGYPGAFVTLNQRAQAIGVLLYKTPLLKMFLKSCFQVTGLVDVNQMMNYPFFTLQVSRLGVQDKNEGNDHADANGEEAKQDYCSGSDEFFHYRT